MRRAFFVTDILIVPKEQSLEFGDDGYVNSDFVSEGLKTEAELSMLMTDLEIDILISEYCRSSGTGKFLSLMTS